MSELAFNANGDAFDVPANVTAWRVRRMKPRGAPELVYGADGRPLTVPIETTIDELRDAVGTAGKYRLDPINDDGKYVEAVPPAYVQVVRQTRNAEPAVASATSASDDVIREAMRMNTELAKSVIDRFSDMMSSAAELLRAADGAGIPARRPREIEADDETEEAPAAPASSPMFEFFNTVVAQAVPLVVSSLAGKGAPKLGAILDWRKAVPAKASTEVATADVPAPAKPAAKLPPIDPAAMAHVIAIQSALAPDEAALARHLAAELAPAEQRAWFDELTGLSVPDAVAKIRATFAALETGGAS